MTGFAVVVERRQWEVVCLYLLLGVSEAASRLPPESVAALIELLERDASVRGRRRRRGR